MERDGKAWVRYDNKKTPFTEEEIENILNTKYHNVLPHTREYIKEGLKKEGGKFKARYSIMVSEDFIEELYKANPNFKNLDLDFSKIPKIINRRDDLISIICNNTIKDIIVGEIQDSQKNWLSKKNNLNRLYPDILNSKPIKEDKNFQGILLKLKENNPNIDFSESKIFNYKTHFKVTCITCKSNFWITLDRVNKNDCKIHCRTCQKSNKDSIEKRKTSWIKRMEELHGDMCDYSQCVYINNQIPITGLICKICGKTFSQYAISHKNGLGCCPSCAKIYVGKQLRSNIENVKKVTEERYGPGVFDWSKAIYETNQTPITLIDIESGTEFEITPNHLMFGSGTPISHSRSLGERHVHKWLGEHQDIITYSSEYYVENISGREGRGSVKIDFRITSINNTQTEIWIECNGLQHYKYDPNYIMFKFYSIEEGKRRFKEGIERDKNVKNYCKENSIIFLEIPYTYYDYDKIYHLLDEFLIKGNQPIIEIPEVEI